MDYYPGDVFVNVIKPLLLPMDLYNMSIVSKYYAKNICESDFRKRVDHEVERRMMECFGDNYENLLELLITSDAIVVGSLVVQCIFGERWQNVTIKIIVDAPSLKNGLSFFLEHHYNFVGYDFGVHGIMGIHCFTAGDFKIGLVCLNLTKYYDSEYDIHKNIYQYNKLGPKLQIHNFKNFMYRCTDIRSYDERREIKKNLEYFKKYYTQGFRFYLSNDKTIKLLSNIELQNLLDKPISISITPIAPENKINLVSHCTILSLMAIK
uniref:Uncharacterized protein n=1 Tax=viral metagenome TaxID=1070528 RepID=A0A6C0C9N7_9ZZZZ